MIHRRTLGALIAAACLVVVPVHGVESPDGVWSDVEQSTLAGKPGARWVSPRRSRTVRLDWSALEPILDSAPPEGSALALATGAELSVPLPDGTFGRFRIEEAPIMAPELAARLPDVATYRGVGLDDPTARARFDRAPAGFHAMIRSASGTVFIDPHTRGDREVYVSYFKRDFAAPEGKRFECLVEPEMLEPPSALPASADRPVPRQAPVANGSTFRQIRLAVAATGEYTTFHSAPDPPNVPAAQAAIVTTINRVNLVYEHDLAIRMVLVDNTDVVFTDPTTDPYSNDCTGAELSQNQATLDAQIGPANYDLGHVMGGPGGGGGVAAIGPCLWGFLDGNFHARGCTGTEQPVGDPYDIDYVAHEIGHQWGALHTWNGSEGDCSAGQRSADDAYEPGSGSTIMAYAGICGSDNLQDHSDDYFHGSSLETITGYAPTIYGVPDCIQSVSSGNTPPTADAGTGHVIPMDTPFTLCGAGSDADQDDVLTYLWEELDPGPFAGPPSDPTRPPFFRSFLPTAEPCRTFPKLSDILANTQTPGEILPQVAWPMTFRLTVFDNHPGAFGGGFDQDETLVEVDGASGPFRITSPDTAVTWTGGASEPVSWDVAGTAGPPVSCPEVDLLLSRDGGASFSTIVPATPNDGSHTFVVPNLPTTAARLEVRCSDGIFFDVNDASFTVSAGTCGPDGFEPDDDSGAAKAIAPAARQGHSLCPAGDEDWVSFTLGAGSEVVLETSGPQGDTVMALFDGAVELIEENDDFEAPLSFFSKIDRECGVDPLPAGTYFVRVVEFGDNDAIDGYDLDLSTAACGCPEDLVLANDTISGPRTFAARGTITLGPNLTLTGPGVVLLAGESVIFASGTEIGSGVRVGIDPGFCP